VPPVDHGGVLVDGAAHEAAGGPQSARTDSVDAAAGDVEVPFDRVVIVYNPRSRGPARELAEKLLRELSWRVPGLPLRFRRSEYAGHARDIAREAADEGGAPLVVSVSGDGGYNEVVNGVLASANGLAAAAVEAAGHANDHRRATERGPLVEAIVDGTLRRIDLLRLRMGSGGGERVRYAHSYIGLGFTSEVVVNLAKGPKGPIAELVTAVRTLAELEAVAVRDDKGVRREYDSLLLANINRLANFARLSDSRDLDDGRFDIITFPHASRWAIVALAFRAATLGLGRQPSATEVQFTPLEHVTLQVDGEVVAVDAEVPVRVEIARRALRTLG
jgi:diacylglycerol kinase family enzyme